VASCTRDFVSNRPIDVEFAQSATAITGTFRVENVSWSFAGYVSLSGGVAGMASLDDPNATAWSQWFVVLERSSDTLIGSLSHNAFRKSTGAMIQTRKYDLVVPLRRVD
jgi:hypothetical protein